MQLQNNLLLKQKTTDVLRHSLTYLLSVKKKHIKFGFQI